MIVPLRPPHTGRRTREGMPDPLASPQVRVTISAANNPVYAPQRNDVVTTMDALPKESDLAVAAVKVPQITLLFWVVKLLSTAMGESTSDYLVFHVNPYVAVVLGTLGLAAAFVLQFRSSRYVAWIYWLTVVMVAVFGTMAADVAHVVIGIPYEVSTAIFAVVLAAVFVVWYLSEHTLSFHTVYPGRRELFYWATVMATFALGTAAGDMTAASLKLGYFPSLLLFVIFFALPLLARRLLGINEIATFWFAYVVTRPLGASFADWVGKPVLGGLGLGDGKIALVLGVLIVVFVASLSSRPRRNGARA